ncbi:hypothetical protein [Brevibacterium sp.]|uniref:hypothetical protein n=1 Tax=Brevibacterium sp. TaxID=1701 RepID=UPI002811014A|nr:hypothetical protein [Brevibacterium sp.]
MRYVVALLIGAGVLFGINHFTGLFSLPRPWGSLLMGATVGLTMIVVLLLWEIARPSQHGEAPEKGESPAKSEPTETGEDRGDRSDRGEFAIAEAGDRSDDVQEAEDMKNEPPADSRSESLAEIAGDHMPDEPGVGEADGSSLENPPPGEARNLGEPTEDDGPAVLGDPGKEVEAPDEIEIPEVAADSDTDPGDGADSTAADSDPAEGSSIDDDSEQRDLTHFDAYGGRTDPDPHPHSDSGVAQEPNRRD